MVDEKREKASKQALDNLRKARESIGEENLERAKELLEQEQSAPKKRVRMPDEVAADILAMIEAETATRH